jgi:putative membrane protein
VPDDPQTVDATRRTHLANERTYLAWWRSGLTAIALAIGVGRVIPEIVGGATWPWVTLGLGFGLFGVGVVALGVHRQRAIDRALHRGEYAPLGSGTVLLVGGFAVLLGLATIALVLLGA